VSKFCGCQVLGFRYYVLGFLFMVSGFGVLGLGLRVEV